MNNSLQLKSDESAVKGFFFCHFVKFSAELFSKLKY